MHRKEIRRVAGRSLRYRRRSQWADRVEEKRVRLMSTNCKRPCVLASILDCVHIKHVSLEIFYTNFLPFPFFLSFSSHRENNFKFNNK